MSKKKEKTKILLGGTAQQRVNTMILDVNRYLATARDILNVPEDWVVAHNQNRVPIGFAPPPEKEKK